MKKYQTLFPEQLFVFDKCLSHVEGKTGSHIMVVNAPAGSGKTYTLNALREVLEEYGIPHVYLAYTGRAASKINARTIHSLLQRPILDENGDIVGWTQRTRSEIISECGNLIVVDEASMNPKEFHDVLVDLEIPIIYVGDNAQLPPIQNEDGPIFNCMWLEEAYHITLTKMRRFGADSGIAEIATSLRKSPSIRRIKKHDVSFVSKVETKKVKFFKDHDIDAVIVGKNATRKTYNRLIRASKGFFGDTPEPGERVMCLRNTVRNEKRANNGELFEVLSVEETEIPSVKRYNLSNVDNGDKFSTLVHNDTWELESVPSNLFKENRELAKSLDAFGFGYALTCHKAQGSGFETILYFDEDVSFFLNQQQFRYTAITRAEKKLYIAI